MCSMPQTDRDESLRRFVAEMVMGRSFGFKWEEKQ
jgi:hypothetical protein